MAFQAPPCLSQTPFCQCAWPAAALRMMHFSSMRVRNLSLKAESKSTRSCLGTPAHWIHPEEKARETSSDLMPGNGMTTWYVEAKSTTLSAGLFLASAVSTQMMSAATTSLKSRATTGLEILWGRALELFSHVRQTNRSAAWSTAGGAPPIFKWRMSSLLGGCPRFWWTLFNVVAMTGLTFPLLLRALLFSLPGVLLRALLLSLPRRVWVGYAFSHLSASS